MPINKNAIIRYHALDQCFNNPGRKYYIENLVEACNNAIYEFTGKYEGIKRRQVFDDIKFMESEQGWSVPLDHIKEGRRVYYRYYEKSFSIKNQPINESELNQLRETLLILNRFKVLPQFEWMEEMLIRMESSFNIKGNLKSFVGFEHNIYLKGLNFFSEIFNAIQYQKALQIQYKSFKQEKPELLILSPYFLKQYNSRWFLFGHNQKLMCLSNLALDRIASINEAKEKFIKNETIDFDEYFDDVIGVTIREGQKVVPILLQINKRLWPYIETKPIHGSQKVKGMNDDFVLIELSLQINYELATKIFSLGEEVKVLAPNELVKIIKTKAEALLKNYI
jgi:predicted DNA-binding transcriptional regulator YafY